MAEIFVGAAVTVLFEKMASADFMKLVQSEGIDSQLNKWKKTLSQIQAVIYDAEQKQIKEKSVELWLQDLQDLAYEIDDIVDDTVSCCDNLECISDKGFGILPLEDLEIKNCKNLKLFPHEHLESLTSLRHLGIYDCPSMDYSFPCGLWPPSLTGLTIGCLKKPMSEWGIQNYPTSLVELVLHGSNSGVASFVGNAKEVTSSSFLLPPSLTHLEIMGFKDVESVTEVLQHLPYLKHLYIELCPKLKDLPETDTTDPSSLKVIVCK